MRSQDDTSGTTIIERRIAGEKFLKGLKQAWQDYQLGMNMLSDVLMYMVGQISILHIKLLTNDNSEPSLLSR